ncbi:hypothetical protein ASPZODRAFT_146518 [Penicilliopsis zonata CBS 506.65]|uniref:REJ domain-containing protein n=1 Tax=Penicilliopsis zonata CBS 506.65 TaxID=1073090 RepID=A0A1L9S711_9EURO|nr:hypothetical protein ASPZODRAFT_146518 [Penicilliopsis zonata CBS 506.65]OJJ42950.1 hypothetical protein ASPZODRAFT_146518 [Penicilliopsis zonata CBS 506.65]
MVLLSFGRRGAQRPLLLLFLLFALLSVARATTTSETTSTETTATTTSTESTASTTTTATAAASTTDDLPSLSTSTSTTDAATTGSSTLPTLSSSSTTTSSSSSTTTYPVITVPPTADAPYMRKTKIPEGTVFIAVGAALGLIGLSVLAWRALVAWSVNRSVRRAAMMQSQESKRLLRSKKKSGVYSATAATMSLDKLGPGARSSHRASHRASRVPSTHSGLFYSPTAGTGMHTAGNRGSGYLPAGYYTATNAAAPGGGQTNNPQPFSPPPLSPMGPTSQGYTRTRSGPSPPQSPLLSPTGGHESAYNRHSHVGASTSSLNLNSPPQGRAPSAYLEDLFDGHTPSPDPHHR